MSAEFFSKPKMFLVRQGNKLKIKFSKRNYNRTRTAVMRWHAKLPEWLRNTLDFVRFVLEFGILWSVVLYGVFRFGIDVWRLLGLGVLFYFATYGVRLAINIWRGS